MVESENNGANDESSHKHIGHDLRHKQFAEVGCAQEKWITGVAIAALTFSTPDGHCEAEQRKCNEGTFRGK